MAHPIATLTRILRTLWPQAGTALAVLLAGLLGAHPFLRGEMPAMVDGELHVVRLAQLHVLLQNGHWYSRWAPDLAWGFGYPLFNYYAPLLYYVATVFLPFGASHTAAMAYTVVLIWLLAAAFAYAWAARVFASRLAGVVCALAYSLSPYLINNAITRAALAEQLGLALLPGVLWALHTLLHAPTRWHALRYGLLLAALQLSHNISALFVAPCIAMVLLFALPAQRARLPLVIALSGLATGLAAFFWLPALLERDLVLIERVTQGFARYSDNFLSLPGLFALAAPMDPLQISTAQLPMTLGPLLGLGALAGFAVAARGPQRTAVWMLAVLAGLFALLATPLSAPLWAALPLLQYAQFPWRMLGFASLFFSGLLAAGVARLQQPGLIRAGMALGLLLILPAFAYQHLRNPIPADSVYTPVQMLNFELNTGLIGTTAGNEYQPRSVPALPNPAASRQLAGNSLLKPGPYVAELINPDPLDFRARISTSVAIDIGLRQFAFAGWVATANGQPLAVRADPADGTLIASLPAGSSLFALRMQATPIQQAAALASAISGLLLLAVLGFARWPRSTHVAVPIVDHIPPVLLLGLAALLAFKLLWVDQSVSPLRPTRLTAAGISQLAFPAATNFGNKILFLGLDAPRISQDRAMLELDAFWQMLDAPGEEVTTALQLRNARGQMVLQSDNISPADHATTRWRPGMYGIDTHRFKLPAGFPSGPYTVDVIAYPRNKPNQPYIIADGELAGRGLQRVEDVWIGGR